MTELAYRLVGYDRETGRVSVEYDIPGRLAGRAKRVAHIPPAAPECLADRPLTEAQANEIADLINQRIDSERLDFMLEPSAPAAVASPAARKVLRAS